MVPTYGNARDIQIGLRSILQGAAKLGIEHDAENRLTQVDGGNTAVYKYDSLGRRVRRTTASGSLDYIRDLAGNVVTDWCVSCGSATRDYVYLNGQQFVEYGTTTYFLTRDHLGSARILTALDHSIYDSIDYAPFGEQISGGGGTTHKFTGKERDSESGVDHFDFRKYSSSIGRFMTPDPIGIFVAGTSFPQSWNLYSYVRNNPDRTKRPTHSTLSSNGHR